MRNYMYICEYWESCVQVHIVCVCKYYVHHPLLVVHFDQTGWHCVIALLPLPSQQV